MANTAWKPSGYTKSVYDKTGVRKYGDGTAKATATFLNGLVLGQGQYLNSQGRLSSFSKLESEDYNNYTYQITVQKEIENLINVDLNYYKVYALGEKPISNTRRKINRFSTQNTHMTYRKWTTL